MNWVWFWYGVCYSAIWSVIHLPLIVNPIRVGVLDKEAIPVNEWSTYKWDPIYVLANGAAWGYLF